VKIELGTKVKYVRKHKDESWESGGTGPVFYPPIGTVGVVVNANDENSLLIQWPEGTTDGDGRWYCGKNFLAEKENN